MDKQRFYVDTEGDDLEAYRKAMQFGCKLADIYTEIKRVILLVNHVQDTGRFDRLYGPDVVKRLFDGVSFKGCKPLVKIETLQSYEDNDRHSDLVISCGLDSDEISKIDDFNSVKVVVSIPWLRRSLESWVKRWNPKEIRVDNG